MTDQIEDSEREDAEAEFISAERLIFFSDAESTG
jgi:hypothetical protein